MRVAYQETSFGHSAAASVQIAAPATGARETTALTIDARMLFHSGIGRYLREVLARWPADGALQETFICNSEEQKEWLTQARPRPTFVVTRAGIYSPGEQLLPLRIPRGSLYWVPHYNLPFSSRAHVVATVHDAAPLVLKDMFSGYLHRLAAAFYFGAVRRTARRVIAVSQFTADELTRHAGLTPDTIEVVPNGVDEGWQSEHAAGPRERFRLLFVGNLKPHKNLGRLLDAIEVLRAQRGLHIELDVVGQAAGFRAGLEARAATRLERTPWIKLHGKVSDVRLRQIYARAAGLVFPSLYEGFGLPMLEAMAAGCPVIASSAGALPEVGGPDHERGGSVVYFDPRDHYSIAERIEYFLRLPASEHARMSELGKQRATTYSWETTATRTRDVILTEARRRSTVRATGQTITLKMR